MSMYDKLHSEEIYMPLDDRIVEEQTKCLLKQYEYNLTKPGENELRFKMLKDMFCELGKGCYIEPPLHANWGGKFVHFGEYVYANFNLTLVDDTHIYVGDYTLFGPNVIVCAGSHPVCPEIRKQGYQFNASVHIGNNVWIGAGSIILPGVHIGDNSVIGAGSVVTKDIPSNVVAVGNPCKVIREINDHDREFYYKNRRFDF